MQLNQIQVTFYMMIIHSTPTHANANTYKVNVYFIWKEKKTMKAPSIVLSLQNRVFFSFLGRHFYLNVSVGVLEVRILTSNIRYKKELHADSFGL